jgi:beta-D-xylosidase 4
LIFIFILFYAIIIKHTDPRWGRIGEGGSEDGYLVSEYANSWTLGFQYGTDGAPGDGNFLLGAITLKHFAANSLENSDNFTRTNFNVNVSNYMMSDYYFVSFLER